jgi:hypothetical protein
MTQKIYVPWEDGKTVEVSDADARIIELLESIEAKLPNPDEALRRHFEMRDALGSVETSNSEVVEAMRLLGQRLREHR